MHHISAFRRLPLAACVILSLCSWGLEAPSAEPPADSLRIVFAGDVMLDGDPGHALAHGRDPFAEFARIFAEADLSVCNLECVVAEGGSRDDKNFVFRAPIASLPVLKRHFSAVCLANNHTGDYGKEAFAEQLDRLDKAGLPYFGGGRNLREARRPLVLERRGFRVALLGYNDFPPRRFEAATDKPGTAWLREKECLAEIAAARKECRADVVIPMLHWGREMHPNPEPYQRDLARRMIDAGADAVIGGHAHVTQTVDLHRGRPIIYSLGNFVFDYYPDDPEVFTGWVVRLTISRTAGVSMETFVAELDQGGIPRLLPKKEESAK